MNDFNWKKWVTCLLCTTLFFTSIPLTGIHVSATGEEDESLSANRVETDVKTDEEIEQEVNSKASNPTDKLSYTLTYRVEDGNAVITGYEGEANGDLVIPEEIDGYKVTSIGRTAFMDCREFTGNLILPSNLTNIEAFAFEYCWELTGSLELPSGLTSIGAHAFRGCSKFTGNLELPNSLAKIGASAFEDCTGFTGSLKLPDNLTCIEASAFDNCTGFTGTLELPNDLTHIESSAFFGCLGFTGTLKLPNSLTKIGEFAFYHCSGFTGTLELPNSLTKIERAAFSWCSGFTGTLELPSGLTSIEWSAFERCTGFTGSPKLPPDLISIETSAFEGCTGFTGTLELPNGLTHIGDSAFKGCTGFTGNLKLPSSLTRIERFAFERCTGFTGTLELPNDLTVIQTSAFEGCSGFTGTLKLPNSLTSIDESAFKDCSGFMGTLELPNDLTVIQTSAFEGCSGFTTLILPAGLSNIKANTFTQCYNLNNIIFTNLPDSFNNNVFLDVIANVYYPSWISGWDSIIDKYYGGTLTWIPYDNGTTPWEISHVEFLSPEPNYNLCGLDQLTCTITFDKNIQELKDGYISLMEYNSGEVIERYNIANEEATYITFHDNILTFKFNRNWNNNSNLSADTKYFITLDNNSVVFDNGEIFPGILNKNDWSFKTCDLEYSLITNSSAAKKIDPSIYKKIYYPLSALLIEKFKSNGSRGVCFGLAYTASAWQGKYSAINLLTSGGMTLKDFHLDTKGKLTNYTFHEYIQMAYIMQHSSLIMKKLKENENQYNKLYESVKNYQNKVGPPIMVATRNYKKGGHAIVPLAIIYENDSSVQFLVYDCRGGHEPYQFLDTMTLKKENGNYVDWEYGNYNNLDDKKGSLSFFEMDNTMDSIIYNNAYYKETSNMIFSQREISDLYELIDYSENPGSESLPSTTHLYWTDDTSISRTAIDDSGLSEIGITDGFKEISANAPLDSNITLALNTDTAQISFKDIADYNISYDNVIDGNIYSFTINGKTSGEFLTTQTDTGIIMTAENLADVTVQFKNSDVLIDEKTFTSFKDSVLIKEENSHITIYEDEDNDGTYEKELTAKEDVVYTVTIKVKKDNTIWKEHDKTFALSPDNGNTFITNLSKVTNGNYLVYDITGVPTSSLSTDAINTGIAVTVADNNTNIAIDYYTVTFYNGQIPYENDTPQKPQILLKGENVSIPLFNPTMPGYRFSGWTTADNVNISFSFDTKIFDTTNIYASWTKDTSDYYTITASTEKGGTISPTGTVLIKEGESQQFAIIPDNTYHLKSIIVDGNEVISDEEKTKESFELKTNVRHYTFSAVNNNHTIVTIFEADNSNIVDNSNNTNDQIQTKPDNNNTNNPDNTISNNKPNSNNSSKANRRQSSNNTNENFNSINHDSTPVKVTQAATDDSSPVEIYILLTSVMVISLLLISQSCKKHNYKN